MSEISFRKDIAVLMFDSWYKTTERHEIVNWGSFLRPFGGGGDGFMLEISFMKDIAVLMFDSWYKGAVISNKK